MDILLNGKKYELSQAMTVSQFLDHLGIQKPGTAVAVNESIVPRGEFEARRIESGERVEIIRAIGGG